VAAAKAAAKATARSQPTRAAARQVEAEQLKMRLRDAMRDALPKGPHPLESAGSYPAVGVDSGGDAEAEASRLFRGIEAGRPAMCTPLTLLHNHVYYDITGGTRYETGLSSTYACIHAHLQHYYWRHEI
jgi:hypothetical protein